MKKCGVKNPIFRCNKNAEDGEGNENLRRVRLCVYAATVENENKKMERTNRRENGEIPIGVRELRENGKRE